MRPISFHSEIHCGFSSHTPHARLRPKSTIPAFICSRLVRRHLLGPSSAWSAPHARLVRRHLPPHTRARRLRHLLPHLLRHLRPSAPSPAPTRSVDPGRHHLLPQGLGPSATAPPRFVSSSCVAMDPTNLRSSGAGRRRSVAAAKGHGQQHVPAPTSLRSPSSPDSQQVQSPNPPWYILWTLVFFY